MNPGKLNHRIRFAEKGVASTDAYGGVTVSETPCVVSEVEPTDVTWGSLEPIRQYNQAALEAGANILRGDKTLIIRYRNNWQPKKDMIFEDLNNAGDIYTVHAILPYWPGTKPGFQNSQDTVYRDKNYIYIVGVKRV